MYNVFTYNMGKREKEEDTIYVFRGHVRANETVKNLVIDYSYLKQKPISSIKFSIKNL